MSETSVTNYQSTLVTSQKSDGSLKARMSETTEYMAKSRTDRSTRGFHKRREISSKGGRFLQKAGDFFKRREISSKGGRFLQKAGDFFSLKDDYLSENSDVRRSLRILTSYNMKFIKITVKN